MSEATVAFFMKAGLYVRMDIGYRDRECDGFDWIGLARDRDQRTAVLNPVMNLQVP
jgi:hypothetical protein